MLEETETLSQANRDGETSELNCEATELFRGAGRSKGNHPDSALREEMLRDIIDHAGDALFIHDSSGRFLDVNKRACEYLGYTREELLGLSVADVDENASQDKLRNIWDEMKPGSAVTFEGMSRRKDGSSFPSEVRVSSIGCDENKLFVVMVRDVSVRKRGSALLRMQRDLAVSLGSSSDVSEAFDILLETVKRVEGIDSGGVFLAEDGEFRLVSHKGISSRLLEEFIHIVPDSPVSHFALQGDPFYWSNPRSVLVSADQAEKEGLSAVVMIPIKYDGDVVAFLIVSSHIHSEIPQDTLDTLELLSAQIGSIVARVRAEQALKDSEERYRMLFNRANDALFVLGIGPDELPGKYLDVNDIACEKLGYSRAELLALSPSELESEDCAETLPFRMKKLLDDGHVLFETTMVGKDGSRIPFEVNVHLFDLKGEPIILSIKRDITDRNRAKEDLIVAHLDLEKRVKQRTDDLLSANERLREEIEERKRVELALRESEERYRAIVDDQTELVSRYSPDGTLTFVNDAYCRFFGETPDELIGRDFWHHMPEEDRAKVKMHVAGLGREHPVASVEHCVIAGTGEVRWQQWIDRVILDERGNVVEIQAVGRDITEQKRTEEALRDSERRLRSLSSKLLSIQEEERKSVAREVHDSIGSYLTGIKINLENLLARANREAIPVESIAPLVSMAQQAMRECRRIMTDLRPSILDDYGIAATMRWLCDRFQAMHPDMRVKLEIHIEEHEIEASLKTVMFRVVQEALINVAKHSGAGSVEVYLLNGNNIELVIWDDGAGFDPAAVFSNAACRGFGLTSMRERVELSGGAFSIQSQIGQGTAIRGIWPKKL